MLKTLEEIEQAIDMLFQEKDASQQTKGRHLLHHQFRMALDKVAGLERTNKRLREELEQYPAYQQQKAMEFLSSVWGDNPFPIQKKKRT